MLTLPLIDSPVDVDTSVADGAPWGMIGALLIVAAIVIYVIGKVAAAFRAVAPAVVVVGIAAVLVIVATAGISVTAKG